MKSFLSLPTTEQVNALSFLEQLKAFDYELFLFNIARLETGISPMIAEKIYREIENICVGSKYGKVTIFLQDGVVTDIEGMRKNKIDEKVDLEERLIVTSDFLEIKVTEEKSE